MNCLQLVRNVWKDMLAKGGPEPLLFSKLTVTDARPGKVSMAMQIEAKHVNRLGSLHGGCITTLVDIGGSLAVASKGLWSTGVTTDLNSTFISAAGGPGNEIAIDCTLDKMGRTLAFTQIEFFNKERTKLLARGSHTKYIVQALRDPNNVKVEA